MIESLLQMALVLTGTLPLEIEQADLDARPSELGPGARPITAAEVSGTRHSQSAATAEPMSRLVAVDGRWRDRFGTALAISGTTAVVGARWADIGEHDERGAVYVFEKHADGWQLQARLLASDGWWLSGFGSSVALEGDTLVAGAEGHFAGGVQRGAAYVFTRTGGEWEEAARPSPGDFGGGASAFGASAGICQGRVLVGAAESRFGDIASRASVSVFARGETGWQRQARLVGEDTLDRDRFGHSLACSGDALLVGSPRADVDGAPDRGAAYVFRRTGDVWTQEAKLVASEGEALDLFGWSVALQGDTAVVGARADSAAGSTSAGAVHVFRRVGDAWQTQARLGAPEGQAGDQFGESVALSGITLLAGARLDGAPGTSEAGSAHAFRWSGATWSWQGRLLPPVDAGSARFGTAVALDGETAIVGAPEVSIDQMEARGAAFVFEGSQPIFWNGFEAKSALD